MNKYILGTSIITFVKMIKWFRVLLCGWENYFIVIGWEQANLSSRLILDLDCSAN